MQCFGSVWVRFTESLGSVEPPNLTKPLSLAEPEPKPVPERFSLPLIISAGYLKITSENQFYLLFSRSFSFPLDQLSSPGF